MAVGMIQIKRPVLCRGHDEEEDGDDENSDEDDDDDDDEHGNK